MILINSYLFFLNRIYRIPSNWFTKCLLKLASVWSLYIIIISFIVYFGGAEVVTLWNCLYKYLVDNISPNWANFSMSIISSILATVIIGIFMKAKKYILNFFYE